MLLVPIAVDTEAEGVELLPKGVAAAPNPLAAGADPNPLAAGADPKLPKPDDGVAGASSTGSGWSIPGIGLPLIGIILLLQNS